MDRQHDAHAVSEHFRVPAISGDCYLLICDGAPVTVRFDPHLAIDVDTIADCRHPDVAPLLRGAGIVV